MSQEINKHLAKAIIDIAIFLEFSDDSILDADAAIAVMEQLASELQIMDEDAKMKLIKQFQMLVAEYAGDRAEFVRTLPDTLGLMPDSWP